MIARHTTTAEQDHVDRVAAQKMFWHSAKVDAYVGALLKAALKLNAQDIVYFNNDDVPDPFQPGDGTTVGALFGMLKSKHVHLIQPWRGSVAAEKIWGGIRKSTRECCNGHPNQLYTLTSVGLAEAWLRQHGGDELRQQEMFG